LALEIVMPRLSDSMEEGTIVSWLVAEGDRLEAGQPLAEIETDKASVTFEADEPGVVLALKVSEGSTVAVGVPIAVVGEAGEEVGGERAEVPMEAAAAAAPRAVETPSASTATSAPVIPEPQTPSRAAHPPQTDRPRASPLARRIAAELNVDLSTLVGSGPAGRVIRSDVETAAAGTRQRPAAPREPDESGGPASPPDPSKGETATQALTRLQQTVARRMAQSRATVPDIELRIEIDMSEAVALRERLREVADLPPSFNDFIVKAAGLALREFPRLNGAYRDSAFESYSRVNVGIAVAAEDALVVPTIFDADRKSLGEIAHEARTLASRVRDGSIAPPEVSGATFTVSNLGMHGVDSFSAVINPPQAAILAVGSLRRRPIVDEPSGELVARPTIIVTLACDHRIVYGVDGAQFLARLRELLQRPHALLL
jgi:pyruvate dehydrogenase E2 component (dihydrolipoyllysine-residue acetyltransferase)